MRRSRYSPPTMAVRNERRLRFRVETISAPPGRSKAARRRHGGGRVGHVLEHLHAGDRVEGLRLLARQRLGRGHAVIDREALLRGMQARHLDHARRQVDAGHPRPGAAQGLREQAAAAADVEQAAAGQRHALGDELRAHRIQQVQRPELALRVPEPGGDGVELGELGVVGVAGAARSCRGLRAQALRPGQRQRGELLGVEAEQAAAGHRGAAGTPHIAHLGARGAEHDGIRDAPERGCGTAAQVEAGEVGGLARLERADLGGETERGRPAEGRQAQRIQRRERRQQRRAARLGQEVERARRRARCRCRARCGPRARAAAAPARTPGAGQPAGSRSGPRRGARAARAPRGAGRRRRWR